MKHSKRDLEMCNQWYSMPHELYCNEFDISIDFATNYRKNIRSTYSSTELNQIEYDIDKHVIETPYWKNKHKSNESTISFTKIIKEELGEKIWNSRMKYIQQPSLWTENDTNIMSDRFVCDILLITPQTYANRDSETLWNTMKEYIL